mmetsp:Transcript_46080/g.81094  ORF Transcript_46080/g.81094 Transcript_46080/m.81094 type:complete len:221 (+) Transcript_46080:50-712(+)
MGRVCMGASLSSLLLLILQIAAASANENQGELESSWAAAVRADVEGRGLELLQYRSSRLDGAEAPSEEEEEVADQLKEEEEADKKPWPKKEELRPECPFPDHHRYLRIGKSCPGQGSEDNGCLNDNRAYEHFEKAWMDCEANEFCGAVMELADGTYFLRRASDPDSVIPDAKLFLYTCKDKEYRAQAIKHQAEELRISEEHHLADVRHALKHAMHFVVGE